MKVFVTGASGFIGSYLVKQLINDGHELLCLKRLTSDISRLADLQIQWVNVTDDWQSTFKESLPPRGSL